MGGFEVDFMFWDFGMVFGVSVFMFFCNQQNEGKRDGFPYICYESLLHT
jgi:hypothetical protein